MTTAVLDKKPSVQASGSGSAREKFAAPIHRNSPEEWLALSDDDFKAQLNLRAENALNSPRLSWQDVKGRLDEENWILLSRIADITENPDIWIPVDEFIVESRRQTDVIFSKYEKGGY
jgi:hypothetical protein